MFERILTLDDPRVADYRGVSDPELLRSRGLFIAEGRLVVTRVLEDRRLVVRSVLVNQAAHRHLGDTLRVAAPGVPVLVCDTDAFLGITGYSIHRGCLALVERPPARALDDLIAASRLAVVLEEVTNADNVGGVFRNAAAFGADLVVLSPGCCSPLYRKAVRTSMGAVLSVPFVHLDEWPAVLTRLRAAEFSLAALTLREPSETLQTFAMRPRAPRLALILGAEGSGLTPAVEAAADCRWRIPIEPTVDSLNLAVAAGIALEQLTRSTRCRGILARPEGPQT